MRTPIRILMALATVATLAVAMPAAAAPKRPILLAPPGNSGITQYAEVVPSDQGATPPRAGGGPGNGPVTVAQQRSFDRLGADGRTLAAVAKATAPPPFSASTKASAANAAAAPIPPISPSVLNGAGARSAFASIADAALGPGGGAVGAIMLVSAVAVVARGVRRRRANS